MSDAPAEPHETPEAGPGWGEGHPSTVTLAPGLGFLGLFVAWPAKILNSRSCPPPKVSPSFTFNCGQAPGGGGGDRTMDVRNVRRSVSRFQCGPRRSPLFFCGVSFVASFT